MENQKDQAKLQTLLSSLTAYNRKWTDPSEHWKIADTYAPYPDQGGNRILQTERVAYVPDILAYQYKLLVAQRHMPQRPIDGRVLGICVNFLTDPKTRTNLLLYGRPGTGKTTYMRAMWMTVGFLYRDEIGRNELRSRYIKASELGAMLKNDKDGYKAIKSATCLFIDDLGFNGESEVVNDYGVKARPIEDIIEHRYDRQLLTVCTTNLTAAEIREKYGERIYSRMCETYSMVGVNGQDYRQI
jgi:DNA replication protein DnaC